LRRTTGIFPFDVACIPISAKTLDSPFIPSRSRSQKIPKLSVFLNWENFAANYGKVSK